MEPTLQTFLSWLHAHPEYVPVVRESIRNMDVDCATDFDSADVQLICDQPQAIRGKPVGLKIQLSRPFMPSCGGTITFKDNENQLLSANAISNRSNPWHIYVTNGSFVGHFTLIKATKLRMITIEFTLDGLNRVIARKDLQVVALRTQFNRKIKTNATASSPISHLLGVGPRLAPHFKEQKIHLIQDLAMLNDVMLEELFRKLKKPNSPLSFEQLKQMRDDALRRTKALLRSNKKCSALPQRQMASTSNQLEEIESPESPEPFGSSNDSCQLSFDLCASTANSLFPPELQDLPEMLQPQSMSEETLWLVGQLEE